MFHTSMEELEFEAANEISAPHSGPQCSHYIVLWVAWNI